MASPYKWPKIHGFHWGWKFHLGISGVMSPYFPNWYLGPLYEWMAIFRGGWDWGVVEEGMCVEVVLFFLLKVPCVLLGSFRSCVLHE